MEEDVEMGGNDNGNKLANDHGGGGGGNTINNASNGSSNQHQNATVGSNVAPAMMNEMSSIPESDHQVPSGWVFPRAQTAALQDCLAVIFGEFECEVRSLYGFGLGIIVSLFPRCSHIMVRICPFYRTNAVVSLRLVSSFAPKNSHDCIYFDTF